MNTLLALDHAVRRFGPAVLTDPAGLRDALRTADVSPSEQAIAALTQAAATPALAWMRDALRTTRDPGHALAAGVDATRSHGHDLPAGPAAARWACIVLGAAAGVLPREWAQRDTPPGAAHQPSRRRGLVLAALAAALTLTVAVVATIAVASYARPSEPVPEPVPVALAGRPTTTPSSPYGTATAPSTSYGTAPTVRHPDYSGASTADPRLAFRDPKLLTLASPYLVERGADCVAQDPSTYFSEVILCYLGRGRVAVFRKAVDSDVLRQARTAFATDAWREARTGTIRSTRWNFAPGQPRLKTDVPGASAGEGTRIRWVTTRGYHDLYFDQDSTTCSGLITARSSAPDSADPLRGYWAGLTR